MKKFREQIIEIDLTIARNDVPYYVGLCNSMLVNKIDDITSNLSIKLESTSEESFPIHQGDIKNIRNFESDDEDNYFDTVYISNVAVGIGTAIMIFGKNISYQKVLRITADIVQEGILQQVVNVTAIATLLPAVTIQNRVSWFMRVPTLGQTVFIGSGTVTAAGATQGIPVVAGASMSKRIAQGVDVYGIVAAGNQDVNIEEGA